MKLSKGKVILLAMFSCLLWSTAFVGVKIGFKYMPAPFTFAGLRFTLAGLMLIPFSWNRRSLSEIIEHKRLISYVVILNTALGYGLYYLGMNYIEGATAAIVVGTGPLITAVMSHFLLKDDKMTKIKLMSILMGITGIAVLMLNTRPTSAVGRLQVFGMLLLISNSTLSSYANIKVAKEKGSINPKFLTSNQMLWGGILLLIAGRIFEGKQNFALPLEFYVSLIWLALVSAVAFSIWFLLIQSRKINVSELNMFKFSIPVLGAVISWTILPEENPEFLSLVGMAFVITGLIVYYKFKDKETV